MRIINETAYKTTTEVQPPAIIDEVDANTTYIGISQTRGDLTSSTTWQIKRIKKTGTVTMTEFPNGEIGFNFSWDSRATYTYNR